jgi:hypothetical protein
MTEASQFGRPVGQPFLYRDHRTYQWWFDDQRWSLTTVAGCVVARVVPDAKFAGCGGLILATADCPTW